MTEVEFRACDHCVPKIFIKKIDEVILVSVCTEHILPNRNRI